MSDANQLTDTSAVSDEFLRLDGNAAAGVLEEIFTFEVTSALCTCAGCGQAAPLGALLLYGGEMGIVLRCPSCGRAELRVARHGGPGGQYCIDMQGMKTLRAIPA
ncbi:MAG TPA: DUF6510 family protein [Ktedonobacterales bacterium]|nr:DUF6510 family protein [Ktedonobacterales bacterium]